MIFSSNGSGCRSRVWSVVAVSLAVASLCVVSGLFSASGPLAPSHVFSNSGQAVAAEIPQAEDHPFAVVAFASVDRLKARATSLGEAIGAPEFSDKWIANGFVGDESLGKLLNSSGIDPTRPIGVMTFPKWFSDKVELAEGSAEDDKKDGDEDNSFAMPSFDDLFGMGFTFLAQGALEDSTFAICIPAKDRDQLLAALSVIAGETFSPMPGRAGWFAAEKNKEMRVLFAGRYVLLIADDGEVKQFDRNYPDFEKLAKASLGQNGFVYSLHRRGLPKIVREDMAEAFKLAHAAGYQRHDDELEAMFKLRTMFGPLATESLDLLLSQIDEFRITGHVDSNTHEIQVNTELIGAKDGKLAKLANAMTTKSSLFGSISTDDALFATNVSLPFSTKLWKPVVEGLQTLGELPMIEVADQPLKWLPGLTRTLAKTIEAGQLEMHVSYARSGEALFALRVAGGDKFPEQIQAALESFVKLHDDAIQVGSVKLVADSIEGWPVHRVRASVLDGLELGDIGWSNLTPNDARPTVKATTKMTTKDGKVVTGTTVMSVPAPEGDPQNYVWVVATPIGLWLALSTPDKREFPEWCRSAVEASLAKSKTTTTASRSNAPVRVVLRGLGASPAATDSANEKSRDAKVTQAAAKEAETVKAIGVEVDANADFEIVGGGRTATVRKPTAEELAAAKAQRERGQQQEQERGDLLRDGDNAVRVELRPTANGLRLRTTFDDAYFHWFATLMKHSLDEAGESQTLPPAEAEPADVKPPQPK